VVENFTAAEMAVKRRTEEIKQLVDRQESNLLHELQSLKSTAENEAQSQLETVQLALTVMESAMELLSKGSTTGVTQAVNDVHDIAKRLLKTHIIPNEYHAPSYKFVPVNTAELLGDDQNIDGNVFEVEHPGNYTAEMLNHHPRSPI